MGDADARTTRPPTAAPQFSPDGKWLAYRAQKRPGFEADKLGPDGASPTDRRAGREAASRAASPPSFDGSVDDFVWMPD